MSKEIRAIKFYLDKSVNKSKKDKLIHFLKECQEVENKLLEYYWQNENYYNVVMCYSNLDFNRIMINYRDVAPRLKSHHYQQVAQKVYATLESSKSNIINKIHFKYNDKNTQRIYNYCKSFCFDWCRLEKYINKQIKQFKKKGNAYYEFLLMIKNYIDNQENFNQLKEDVEGQFWDVKFNHKPPEKKTFQILCNTAHTLKIDTKEFEWWFTLSSNTRIGGSERRGVYEKLIIPVKFSEYHKQKLEGRKLKNTFNIKLNSYERIEIIGCYEIETNNTEANPNHVVGIDIGLKKLITSSDGEVVEQNPKIIKEAKSMIKKQSNRDLLEQHLKKKYDNPDFRLSDKKYLRKQLKLTNFVKMDNRYKIKQFLKGRENDLIIMENLELAYTKTFHKETNYLMKRIGIQGLCSNIQDYAKKSGVQIALVNPAFTSQQCPICGHVSKKNRKTQEMFCCVKCNHTDNADHNASVNIMNRYFDDRINLNTPIWRVKEILMRNT